MRTQADHLSKNDGKFFMEFSDYVRQLEYTDLSIDVESWHHAGFAVLNDDAPFNR